MKKLLALSLLSVLIYSCKKSNNSSSNHSGQLLSLTVDSIFQAGGFAGIDSNVYTYDGDGKIKSTIFTYIADSEKVYSVKTYQRDSKGRTSMITQSYQYLVNGVNQVDDELGITEVIYQSGSDKINYIYYYGSSEGKDNGDSVTYEYSGAYVSATHAWQLSSGEPAELLADNTFTFNGNGELTAYTLYAQDQSERVDYTFTLDGKTNPLKLGLEEVNSVGGSCSPDNIAKQVAHTYEDGNTTTVTESYTYRDDGRPLVAISGGDANALIRHTHYYYQ